ncbi:MAG: hypothetical protein JW936_11390 [Sedimentisphaerales bacterium]|nr:hypothetical protein [Sedimentisphaerales bacterium]
MKRRRTVFLAACLLGLIAMSLQADPNSGEPDYVFTTVNEYGWIDAGSSPDWNRYSYKYVNLEDSAFPSSWAANATGLTGELFYRFEAPEGKMIDELQFGLHGWHDFDSDPAHWYYYAVIVQVNGELTIQHSEPGGQFYFDVGAELEPTHEVEVWIRLLNYGGAGDESQLYGTWLVPGNDYEFAAHVCDAPDSDGIMDLEPDGSFNLRGPVGQFMDWATNNFNAAPSNHVNGISTHATMGYTVTGPQVKDGRCTVAIPFRLPEGRVYDTARLDYSSQVYAYGDPGGDTNSGFVKLTVVTDSGTTQIYYHQSPDYVGQPLSMNYDPCGGVPNGGVSEPFFRAFTDISDLVAGENAFELQIEVLLGWSGWIYNGGWFLPARNDLLDIDAGELDFYFTGTTAEGTVPPPLGPNEFEIRGPVYDFVDWAKGFGATGDMETFGYLNTWYTGCDNYDTTRTLSIPFEFPRPLVDARLEYGSTLGSYGDNLGYGKIDLVTEDGITQIYYHQSPDLEGDPAYPPSMNYTPDGGVPNSGAPGYYRVYTDIDDLVNGKTEFVLNITMSTGWSGWLYNGCQFLPSYEGMLGDSDFIMSGHLVDGPSYCGDAYTYYVGADLSGPGDAPDCIVNLYDFAVMANQWLNCSTPGDSGCTQHWQW